MRLQWAFLVAGSSDLLIFRTKNNSSSDNAHIRDLQRHIDPNTDERRRTQTDETKDETTIAPTTRGHGARAGPRQRRNLLFRSRSRCPATTCWLSVIWPHFSTRVRRRLRPSVVVDVVMDVGRGSLRGRLHICSRAPDSWSGVFPTSLHQRGGTIDLARWEPCGIPSTVRWDVGGTARLGCDPPSTDAMLLSWPGLVGLGASGVVCVCGRAA